MRRSGVRLPEAAPKFNSGSAGHSALQDPVRFPDSMLQRCRVRWDAGQALDLEPHPRPTRIGSARRQPRAA